jgi:hypothetical protein
MSIARSSRPLRSITMGTSGMVEKPFQKRCAGRGGGELE